MGQHLRDTGRRTDSIRTPFEIPPAPSTPRVYRTGRPHDPLLCGACFGYTVTRHRGIGHTTYHCSQCDRTRTVSSEFDSDPMVQAMLMAKPVVRGK